MRLHRFAWWISTTDRAYKKKDRASWIKFAKTYPAREVAHPPDGRQPEGRGSQKWWHNVSHELELLPYAENRDGCGHKRRRE